MFKTLINVLLLTGIIVGGYLYLNREKVVPTIDLPAVSYQDVRDSVSLDSATKLIDDVKNSEVVDNIVNNVDGVLPGNVEIVTEEVIPEPQPGADDTAVTTDLPVTYNLAVPFTSQAPSGNWALPYQEACEEASIYMVTEYYKGTPAGKIDPVLAEAAINEIVDFENTFLGFYFDTTVAETASIVDSYYGYHTRVIENPTIDDIKRQVADNRPVIVPAAGRELGNPNFSGVGPLYHMLVIKGYTADKFITNDPGTRNGENYGYDFNVIMEAMGDWNGGDPAHGAKRILVITP